jgi:hypothetical protein
MGLEYFVSDLILNFIKLGKGFSDDGKQHIPCIMFSFVQFVTKNLLKRF